MNDTQRTRRRSSPSVLFWVALLVLGLALSGCDGHFLSLDCIGSSGYCGVPLPTPEGGPGMLATATAITATKPLFSDPLQKQDANAWPVDNTCNFHNHAYYVKHSDTSNGTYTCITEKFSQRDGAFALDVTLYSGDSAGLILRGDHGMNNFYEFMVSQEAFALGAFINNQATTIIPASPSTAIHGNGQVNHLLAIVQGNDLKLYINGSFVDEVHNSSIQGAGFVGVSLAYDPTGEASFADLAVYKV